MNQTEENGVFGRRFYFNTNDCNFVPFVLDIYIFNNTNADYIVIYINIEYSKNNNHSFILWLSIKYQYYFIIKSACYNEKNNRKDIKI